MLGFYTSFLVRPIELLLLRLDPIMYFSLCTHIQYIILEYVLQITNSYIHTAVILYYYTVFIFISIFISTSIYIYICVCVYIFHFSIAPVAFSSSAISCSSLSCQLRCMRCLRRRSTASRRSSSAARAPHAKLWRALKRSGTGMSWDLKKMMCWCASFKWRFFDEAVVIWLSPVWFIVVYCYVMAILWLFATLWLFHVLWLFYGDMTWHMIWDV